MINAKLRTVFVHWSDENKMKAIETIGDDEMKSVLSYDRGRAFEMFKNRLEDEYFNGLFDEYYQPIRKALEEKKAKVKKRLPKVNAENRMEAVDAEIKSLQAQIARLQIEKTRLIEAEKEKALCDAKKMIERLSPEQRAALIASLQ